MSVRMSSHVAVSRKVMPILACPLLSHQAEPLHDSTGVDRVTGTSWVSEWEHDEGLIDGWRTLTDDGSGRSGDE